MQITRSLAHQLRSVFRRCVSKSSSSRPAVVLFEANKSGLTIRLQQVDVAVDFQQPGSLPAEAPVVPLEALGEFAGKKTDLVSLENTTKGTVLVRWQEGVMPHVREYDATDPTSLPPPPDVSNETEVNEPGFLKALLDAAQTLSKDSVRYALNHVQLRGSAGKIVAIDGKQLLVQSGFRFPWKEDVLISAPLLACQGLPQQEEVRVGKTANHVTLQVGTWTLHLAMDRESRYPRTSDVIPRLSGSIARLHLHPADAEFLNAAIPQVPGGEELNAPLTLDLAKDVCVRARDGGKGRVTELLLVRSSCTGKAVRVCVNRQFVRRGAALGFGDLCVVDPNTPIVFQEERREYVVMPLNEVTGLGPSKDALCIASTAEEETATRRPETVQSVPEAAPVAEQVLAAADPSEVRSNGHVHRGRASEGSLSDLIAEAEGLKDDLRRAYTRTHQLLTAAKKYRRQNQLVQSTLATLQQLKKVAG